MPIRLNNLFLYRQLCSGNEFEAPLYTSPFVALAIRMRVHHRRPSLFRPSEGGMFNI